MCRFSRIDGFVCLFAALLLTEGCSKKLSEEQANSMLEAEFKPKPIVCTARLRANVEHSFASASAYVSYLANSTLHHPPVTRSQERA
jgi:hypothetical protein